MKVLKVHLKLHWGFSIRKPYFSASQPSFKVPPPSTLIGALARAFASYKRLPEVIAKASKHGREYYSSCVELLRFCKWVTVAVIDENMLPFEGPIETKDLMRALIAPYLRRSNIYPGSRMLYAPQAHGKIYFPDLDMVASYFVNDEIVKDLERIAWSIVAVGSKESVACTVNVKVLDLREIKETLVKTRYYFEKDLIKSIREGSYIEEYMTIPTEEHYKLASIKVHSRVFVIPIGELLVEVDNNKAFVFCDNDGDVYILRKEVVR